jgi:uncharacterized protein YndB with AHSA1/START domain
MSDIVKAGTTVSFERIFDAPRELVFQAWTDAKQGWAGSLDRLHDHLATDA